MASEFSNSFVAVQRYIEGFTGALENVSALISPLVANYNHNDFNQLTGQRGQTIQISLPKRSDAVPEFPSVGMQTTSPIQERKLPLTVDKKWTENWSYNPIERTFFDPENIDEEKLKLMTTTLGGYMIIDAAKTLEQNTYRFYNPGINYTGLIPKVERLQSIADIVRMIQYFKLYGCIYYDMNIIFDMLTPVSLVNNALSQFAVNRNNNYSASWNLGNVAGANIFVDNMLQIHNAGEIGNAIVSGGPLLLQVQSFITQADGGISQITFEPLSGQTLPVSTTNGAAAYDVFEFVDNVGNLPNLRYLTRGTNYVPTDAPVQCMVTQAAPSTATSITLNFTPALYYYDPNTSPNTFNKLERNLNNPIQVGMRIQIMPSHRVGVIMSGKPLLIAAPKIQCPHNNFAEYKKTGYRTKDEISMSVRNNENGASFTMQVGRTFPELDTRFYGTVLYGQALYNEQAMRIILPTNI